MDLSDELTNLRAEQRRLRAALDGLDHRIAAMEFQASIPEELIVPPPPVPEILEPTPIPAPVEEVQPPILPEPVSLPVFAQDIASVPVIEEPAPPPPVTPTRPRESLELQFGQVWLVRIGIVILITGLVFLGNYAYHELIGRLGAGGKLALLYLAGAGLSALGGWLARRQASMQNYGRVLAAGGCATIYYATYAAHFVPTLRVIESPLIGGTLLLALGGAFVAWSDRLRSQTLAAATIALSFYTATINPVATFSLFSNLVISTAAVILLARRRWVSVSFLSLLGTYGSLAFWRFQQSGTFLPTEVAPGVFWTAVLFPAGYWIVHTVAVLLRRVSTFDPSVRPTFLTLNNAAFFALTGPVIAGTYPHLFWLAAVSFGAVLLGLAIIAARTAPEETSFDSSYLAQGLGLVFVGLLYKFTGWQLALSFSLLSAMLISLSRWRHGGIYQFFAGACALVATYVSFDGFFASAPYARLTAGGVALILTGTAWQLKRIVGFVRRFDLRVFAFALLAGLLAVPACLGDSTLWSGVRILAVALVAMLLLRLHRLSELAYVAQPLALAGQLVLLFHSVFGYPPSNPVALSTVFALAFIHLWQWLGSQLAGRRTWQTLHGIVPIILTMTWTFESLTPVQQGPVLALLAILLLAYARLTRTWIIAAFSLPFTLVAGAVALRAIVDQLPWGSAAATIGLLVAQSFLLRPLAHRAPVPPSTLPISAIGLRSLSLLLGLIAVFAYIPGQAWFLTLVLAAFAILLVAMRSKEALAYTIVIGATAGVEWIARLPIAEPQWSDLLGFVLIVVAQQIIKRRREGPGAIGSQIGALLAGIAVLGTWIVIHRLVGMVAGGFLVTASWSLLAFAVLGMGFLLRERAYRLLGLAIITCAIGRIFFIDVWQLETLFRILSFLTLGAVLLALGFLYNRHAETLRRWL